MIVERVRGDIFETTARHIVFAINTEGINDSGFAGLVAARYWPELKSTGRRALDDVVSRTVGERTFHAIVCHSLAAHGWDYAASAVFHGLSAVRDAHPDDEIAIVAIGRGPVGLAQGANADAIEKAMDAHKAGLILYTGAP